MIKLYVGDMNAAKAFYGGAFGAKPALEIGSNANILTFPNGGPGLVLPHDPGVGRRSWCETARYVRRQPRRSKCPIYRSPRSLG